MQGLAGAFWWVNVLGCAYCTLYWARQRRNDGTPGLMTPGGQVWAWQLVFCFIVLVLDVSPWHLFWLGLVSIVLSVIVSNVWRGRMLAARYPDIGKIEVQQGDSRTRSLPAVAQTPATTQAAGITPSLLSKANTGDATSQRLVAEAYKEGRGVLKDNEEAYVWYRKAATGGDAESQLQVGFLYWVNFKIQGDAQDGLQAELWLRRAAEQGHAFAQRHLAGIYETGTGVEQDFAQAAHWYSKAAEQGDSAAQFGLGELYEVGHGVPKDSRQALALYQKAAEQGHSSAQVKLGVEHAFGLYLPKDEAKSASWYQKAAIQGNPEGQFLLGVCYELGNGVRKDAVQAATLVTTAAKQGHPRAQYWLGKYYWKGHGVPQDYA